MWRARPAKERRNSRDLRQLRDPTMPLVASVEYVGEIRWSDGHGRWPARYRTEVGPPLQRGYWLQCQRWSFDPAYIGETVVEVNEAIASALEERISAARRMLSAEIRRAALIMNDYGAVVARFDHQMRQRVLDQLVSAVDLATVEDASAPST